MANLKERSKTIVKMECVVETWTQVVWMLRVLTVVSILLRVTGFQFSFRGLRPQWQKDWERDHPVREQARALLYVNERSINE